MKKILSLLLVVTALAGIVSLAAGGTTLRQTVQAVAARQSRTEPGYQAAEWAKNELAKADDTGLVPRSLAESDLTKPITRREYAAAAVALFRRLVEQNPDAVVMEREASIPEGMPWPFSDVEDADVTQAYCWGLIEGVGNGKFDPDGSLTREQAATILRRMMYSSGMTVPGAGGINFQDLTDGDAVSVWARESVVLMYDMNVIKGKPDGAGGVKFDPQGTLTGQEALVMNGRMADRTAAILGLGTAGYTSFNADFFAAVQSGSNKSLSPVSLRYALGLLQAGSEGETRAQLDRLLDDADFDAWNQVLRTDPAGGPTVEVANSIWFDTSVVPDGNYLNTVKTAFDAQSQTLALTTQRAVQVINAWVSEKTHGLIPTILDGPLSGDAAAVLLNALYFKGDWAFPFDPNDTFDQTFRSRDGTEAKIPFMHDTRRGMQYISTASCVGVALPYDGGELPGLPEGADPNGDYPTNNGWWMIALLPRNGGEAGSLAGEDFAALLEGAQSAYVRLALPKFTIEGSYDLTQPLKDMGLGAAFTGGDFGPMGTCSKGDLFLSKVLQKTYLRVDEKGTEAAAVTGVIMAGSAFDPESPIDLTFDRPFLCCLWNSQIDQPLFLTAVDELKA